MGSKKYPIVPISLLIVVGIPISNMALIFPLFGFKSFLVILKFLGRKKKRTKIDVSSLIIFVNTTKATAYSNPYFIKIGIPIIRATNLIKSSVMFEIT